MNIKNTINNNWYIILIGLLLVFAWGARFTIDGLFLTYPGNIKAADPFYHTSVASGIIEGSSPSYGHFQSYLSEGRSNIVDSSPPLNYLATAALTKISGVKVWNVMYLLETLCDAFIILLLFILCSKLFKSKAIGLIAAAFYVMPSPLSKWWYAMQIGMYNNVIGICFFVAMLWLSYEYVQEPKRWKIASIGILIAATWLVHVAEMFLTAAFAAVIGLYILTRIKGLREKIIHIALASTIPLISIILFWPKYKIWSSFTRLGFSWNIEILRTYPFFTTIWDFAPWILILFAIGAVMLIRNFKQYKLLLLSEAYLLIYLMIFPLILKSYYFFVRQRFALPFVIAPFVAYGTYTVLSTINSKLKINIDWLVFGVVALLLVLPLGEYITLKSQYSYQHLTQEKYDALVTIQQSTPINAEFLFLTGYYQTSSQQSKRVGFVLDLPKLPLVVDEFYRTGELPLMTLEDHGETIQAMATDISFFKYKYYPERDSVPMNYTEFDYIVLNNFVPQIGQFNADVGNYLIKQGYKIVYISNDEQTFILSSPENRKVYIDLNNYTNKTREN